MGLKPELERVMVEQYKSLIATTVNHLKNVRVIRKYVEELGVNGETREVAQLRADPERKCKAVNATEVQLEVQAVMEVLQGPFHATLVRVQVVPGRRGVYGHHALKLVEEAGEVETGTSLKRRRLQAQS